ncbi:hypothetical protein ACI0FS_07405 [Ochrobactrum quorumnocens]|uniref:hypothetical protein n=1 Tax=Ochrobactrum quorumnocens TaxID=271865 RepID=UPI0038534A15
MKKQALSLIAVVAIALAASGCQSTDRKDRDWATTNRTHQAVPPLRILRNSLSCRTIGKLNPEKEKGRAISRPFCAIVSAGTSAVTTTAMAL